MSVNVKTENGLTKLAGLYDASEISAEGVAYDNTETGMTADNVQDAIDEVFQYGNNRKSQLVDKIVAKGGTSSTSESWDDVIDDIDTIPSGGNADNFPLTYKDDYYVDHQTGQEVYESGDHCTDFVDISGYSKIIAYHTDDWQNKFYNVFYDENENYISYFTVNGYVSVTVPNNAKYVRLSTAKTSPCMVIGYN